MASYEALTVQAGVQKQIHSPDVLEVGAGITTDAGNLSISAVGATIAPDGTKNWVSTAGAGNFDLSLQTGTFKSSTGGFTITGTTLSSLTTTGGVALTITADAASTWSTSAGALTVQGATALTLNGQTTGINLQSIGATRFDIGVTAAKTLTAAATTSAIFTAGLIDLNGSTGTDAGGVATTGFAIQGTQTHFAVPGTGQVTAPNLDTVTAGPASNADALHTHTGLGNVTLVSGQALTAGQLVSLDNNAGTPGVFLADANGATTRPNAIGIVATTVGASGSPVVVYQSTSVTVPDAFWDGGAPAAADIGKRVYMSETAGNITLTAPSTTGSTSLGVGVVSNGGGAANTSKLLISITEPVVL